ncbi:hypothetical protein KIN20_007636, partial [Parelaphostrongylus tenuis]
ARLANQEMFPTNLGSLVLYSYSQSKPKQNREKESRPSSSTPLQTLIGARLRHPPCLALEYPGHIAL